MTIQPSWNSASTLASVLVSSLRVTNDPNAANDFCEVSVQVVGGSAQPS